MSEDAHEQFVDSMIRRNVVLLGGELELTGASAAYVLRASISEAEKIVAQDPLVLAGAARARLVPWDLVGINPAAIDEALLIRPEDIA